MNESCFVDGLQNQVRVISNALSNIIQYIDTLETPDNINQLINAIANLFYQIKNLTNLSSAGPNNLNKEEKRLDFYH